MSAKTIVIFCGLLMSSAAFSIDIMLPSFPAIASNLSTPETFVQWTITIFLVSAGAGQIVWGGASDKFGRKPVLAVGIALFLVGCVLATIAPNIQLLLAARALQGFGAAAAMVLSRAVVRDLHSGDELARSMAFATAIFAAGPIVAPLVGGLIAEFAGWRVIFVVLSIYSVVLLSMLQRMPETLKQKTDDVLRPATVFRRSKRILTNPQSRYFLLLAAISNASMLLILTSTPLIYEANFGVTGLIFAMFFASHGIAIIFGQMANRRLIAKYGTVRAMVFAGLVLVLATSLMLSGGYLEALNPYLMSMLLFLFATSYLIVYSNCSALVLDPHGDIAGFAASFFGFFSQVGCSVLVSILVVFTGSSIVKFGIAMLAICATSLGGVLWWQAGWRKRVAAT